MAKQAIVREGDLVRIKDTGQVRLVRRVWAHGVRTRVDLRDATDSVGFTLNATEVEVVKASVSNEWVKRNGFTRTLAVVGFLAVASGAAAVVYYLYRRGVPVWMVFPISVMAFQAIDDIYSNVIRVLDGRPIR